MILYIYTLVFYMYVYTFILHYVHLFFKITLLMYAFYNDVYKCHFILNKRILFLFKITAFNVRVLYYMYIKYTYIVFNWFP